MRKVFGTGRVCEGHMDPPSRPARYVLKNRGTDLQTMNDDPPCIRCPCCGSLLTSPLKGTEMWECRYHLCRAVFPVFPCNESSQPAPVAEEEPGYPMVRKRKKRE
jgi:hypothetical protein